MKPILVSPSLLSADFANLSKDIQMLNLSQADYIHLDIMDGVFVPNISFGFPVIKSIASLSEKPLDIHLMIIDPDRYIPSFAKFKPRYITVHVEACHHLHRTIQLIKQHNVGAGVAINPHTPVQTLENIIMDIDLICVMGVNPGFGGQSFIPNTLNKIKKLKEIIVSSGSNALIEMDGGLTANNGSEIIQAGADILVGGNLIFSATNPLEMIQYIKHLN